MAVPNGGEPFMEELTEMMDLLNVHDNDLRKLFQEIYRLRLSDGSCENTVFYSSYCKLAAQLCYKHDLYSNLLYYLSESHAADLRQICHRWRVMFSNQNSCHSDLSDEYTSFQSSYANSHYDGLCKRIKELPTEWTLVQITQQFHTGEAWELRKPNTVVNETGLHIVRYNCGTTEMPVHVFIPPLTNVYSSENILDVINNSVLDRSFHTKGKRSALIRKRRLENCSKLKEVTRDIANVWLREWRCLLLGKICDKEIENAIRETIDNVFEAEESSIAELSKLLIHQVANGCGLLEKFDIENALTPLIKDNALRAQLLKKILELQNRFENVLYYVKRYPVIFLIDEKLQCMPWEETLGIRNQAISRLPSVHFVHEFYKMHESKIVNGNVKISSHEVTGYYVINPDQTLQNTEEQMVNFLEKRFPTWRGTVGAIKTKEEITNAVTKYDIFLYCGHGSGSQYVKSSQLISLKAKAIPLLFGCGSVEYKDHGGRVPFSSHANFYLISGSPCVVGMLWSVTSKDTDKMALALLNYWLPGKPVVIDGMEKFDEDQIHSAGTEPELLRAVRFSRSVADYNFNSCAMVVHGLPVIIQ